MMAIDRYLGLDLVGVALGQLLLAGRWDQDVTVRLQDRSCVRSCVGEPDNGPVLLEEEPSVSWSNRHTLTSLMILIIFSK